MHTQGASGKEAVRTSVGKRNRKVDIHFRIPEKNLDEVKRFILSQGGTVEYSESEDESIPWKDAFPGAHPGMALHGLRVREGLTQKELAEKLGEAQSHISAMEKGKRPIGKALAKKLAETFGGDYRAFL
jgi:DNA-binding XRE family transcriptional regulator